MTQVRFERILPEESALHCGLWQRTMNLSCLCTPGVAGWFPTVGSTQGVRSGRRPLPGTGLGGPSMGDSLSPVSQCDVRPRRRWW